MIILTKWNKNRGKRTKFYFFPIFPNYRARMQKEEQKGRASSLSYAYPVQPLAPVPIIPSVESGAADCHAGCETRSQYYRPSQRASHVREISPTTIPGTPRGFAFYTDSNRERHRVSWPRFDLMIFNPSADVNVTVAGREI